MAPFSIGQRRRLAILAATAAMCLGAAGSAAAQYQWRDAQGRMVYSDQPPPASVSADRILRSARPAAGGSAAPAATAAPAAPTHTDRELAWRKRRAEAEEQEKKAAEAASRKLALAQVCEDLKGAIRSLERGQRLTRIDAAGAREFIPDAERLERLAAARKNAGERC